MASARLRLLFVVTEDWYFWSHRLDIALAARAAGFDVALATRVGALGARIEAAGIELLPLRKMRRGDLGPVAQWQATRELAAVYRRWQPDIVHHVALKPIVCGSLAARLVGVRRVVNAVAGLGFVFSSGRLLARVLRPAMTAALRLALRRAGTLTIVQNPADAAALVERGLVASGSTRLIRGTGVDLGRFHPAAAAPSPPVVMLAARLLWDKGIGEFVAAARVLRSRGSEARFVLAGASDPDNPASIDATQVAAWTAAGEVETWGRVDDMAAAWRQASIACLPSYAEGLPKVLVEAAACGLPIVATDIPGCREAVQHEISGLLVPLRDPQRLADALDTLLADESLRARFGRAGRALAEQRFDVRSINRQTIDVYLELLAQP